MSNDPWTTHESSLPQHASAEQQEAARRYVRRRLGDRAGEVLAMLGLDDG